MKNEFSPLEDKTEVVFVGPFVEDEALPTCGGLGLAINESQMLPRQDFLLEAKRVMEAIWNQPLPGPHIQPPDADSIDSLVRAIESGWAFNANEADTLYSMFGDIRSIERRGRIVGVGTQAPDGAFIHDGRELVAWRARRWASLQGPLAHREGCSGNHLRIVRSR